MSNTINLILATIFLFLGIPLGNFLARITKEELQSGQEWFKILIIICLIGGFMSLVFKNDILMFTLFFIAIVTSRSLLKRKSLLKVKN